MTPFWSNRTRVMCSRNPVESIRHPAFVPDKPLKLVTLVCVHYCCCAAPTRKGLSMSVSTALTRNTSMGLIMALTAFAAVSSVYFRFRRKALQQHNKDDDSNSLSNIASRRASLKPPFPLVVREVLSSSRLAYLSTVDSDLASSHLSLMRFTYLNDTEDGEVVIMSTSVKTKKFEMLKNQRGVALLVHDFQQDGKHGLYSITLNGDCSIVASPTKAEHYRAAHLKHNPDFPQFIVGNDIAILCIHVTSARICNVHDQVTMWHAATSE